MSSQTRAAGRPTARAQDWGAPLARENLSERAFAALKDALMSGKLVPGEKLLLRPLSERFGVSATPMREALLRLVSKEVLTLDARGTVIVPELTTTQLKEIHDIRVDLEGRAAARAAECGSAADFDELDEIHQGLVAAQEADDYLTAITLNTKFHLTLCRIARLTITQEIVESLWLRCGPILSHLYDDGPPFSGKHPHVEVIEALRTGDGKAACAAIREDIRKGGKGLYRHMQDERTEAT